jgi:hypothetical protein
MYGQPMYGQPMMQPMQPMYGQPMMQPMQMQYARLPGMVTMNPYLVVPTFYNRVFYQ